MNSNKADYFDKLGDDFELFMSDYDVERRMSLIFDTLLANHDLESKDVLEVGCGTGRFSLEIAQCGATLTVLDIGENLVGNVSKKLSCNGIVCDACKIELEDNSFDYVISSECIEHTSAPLEAVREMCRVCKPGGIVVITTPNLLWYPVLWLSHILKIRKFEGIENWVSPGQLKSEMKKAKMSNITISGCHLWPFQIKFSRPLLRFFDKCGKLLYPLMINTGIMGQKG